jgi:predicted phage terminase large subunit-like protein
LASTQQFSASPDNYAARLALLAAVVAKRKAVALAPEGKLLDFTRWYFPEREGMEFIEGPHHRIIGDTLDRVLSGEIRRLIINVPPGYTKTEAAVVNLIAKGFHINPKARFIHSTFSDDLARENSDKVLQLVALEGYQAVKAVEIRHDSSAKDRWKTTAGGGMLAKAAGGPITGFRAGYMDKTMFTGALVIDDPLKPDDAFSPTKRKTVNQRATNTFRSRLAHDGVPIIAIMQRLHSDDFAGHLLTGGTGEKWHHLNLPVMINNSEAYPIEWTHGIPIQHNLPDGPLWREKHDEAEIEVLKADAYTYASQYMQRPVSIEGALFDMTGFRWWNPGELPAIEYYSIYGDTAQKTGERNDFSVIQLWGKADTGIYLVDQVRGKWEAPQLDDMAQAFWNKHRGKHVRGFNIEDKASGTGLIQSLRKKGVPVVGIPRDRDKYTRGLDAAPWIATGMVHLPANEEWTVALRAELQMFDGLGTGWDDQVDPLMDAIADMLAETNGSSGWFMTR